MPEKEDIVVVVVVVVVAVVVVVVEFAFVVVRNVTRCSGRWRSLEVSRFQSRNKKDPIRLNLTDASKEGN